MKINYRWIAIEKKIKKIQSDFISTIQQHNVQILTYLKDRNKMKEEILSKRIKALIKLTIFIFEDCAP